ncbi:hypothetical protein Pcinc_022411 [Petrolisthes cinctipes]|uniref:Uncharacterized protein n=1 Tax=Petrolisthes cinctipes TaxID=88211 RepID=A0AAE1KG00_PETCI|nr:hypothetical protein Pcinc_022411 [Petrolisthes cinctipes]
MSRTTFQPRTLLMLAVVLLSSRLECCRGFFFGFSTVDLCQEGSGCCCSPHLTQFQEKGMDCRGANLATLPEDLKLPEGATRADFSRNNLTFLYRATFTTPSPTLLVLDLSDNRLGGLEGGGLVGLGVLQQLLLSNNVINDLDVEAFKGLGNLTTLDLSYNQLTEIPDQLLAPLSNLQHLNLGFNPIPSLNSSLLDRLPNLRHLDLSRLGIETIDTELFSGNVSLEWLSLSHNLISVVPTSALAHLSDTLTYLDLSGNPITSLGGYSFSSLTNVKTLVLEQMLKLRTIEAYAFGDLRSLDTVALRYMPKIESVDPKAFHSLEEEDKDVALTIQDFTFSFSVLSTLPSTLLPWSSLKFVSLEYNHWTCDCNMLWVKNSSLMTKLDDRLVCSRPMRLRGHRLRRIPDEEFTCGEEPPVSTNATVGFLVVVMLAGLCASLATVSLLVYYRRGWVCWRPQGAYRHIQRGASTITIEEEMVGTSEA